MQNGWSPVSRSLLRRPFLEAEVFLEGKFYFQSKLQVGVLRTFLLLRGSKNPCLYSWLRRMHLGSHPPTSAPQWFLSSWTFRCYKLVNVCEHHRALSTMSPIWLSSLDLEDVQASPERGWRNTLHVCARVLRTIYRWGKTKWAATNQDIRCLLWSTMQVYIVMFKQDKSDRLRSLTYIEIYFVKIELVLFSMGWARSGHLPEVWQAKPWAFKYLGARAWGVGLVALASSRMIVGCVGGPVVPCMKRFVKLGVQVWWLRNCSKIVCRRSVIMNCPPFHHEELVVFTWLHCGPTIFAHVAQSTLCSLQSLNQVMLPFWIKHHS